MKPAYTNQSGGNTILDISSPYFLTSSARPGQNYVGDDLLRDGNYGDWKSEMTNALFAKNKIGFVGGSIPMPKEGSSNHGNWMQCNAMVRGWLTSTMTKEIKNSVKYATTARDIWIDLQERFGTENAPRAYELRRVVTTIRQEDLSISAYYTKLRGVWDEIQSVTPTPTCTCGGCKCGLAKEIADLREKESLYDFLMGLNVEYGAIKTQILSSRPLHTLGEAFHLVSQDEQQRLIGTTRKMASESAAFQISAKTFSRPTSKFSTQISKKKEDRGGIDKRNDDRWCTQCKKSGHVIDVCFEIEGYPDWWTEKYGKPKVKSYPRAAAVTEEIILIGGFTREEHAQLLEIIRAKRKTAQITQPPVANMSGKANSLNSWIIDSRASEHITHNERLLETVVKIDGSSPVKIPNGDFIPVKNIGNAYLTNGLKLEHVLNVPNFKCNLLSVSRLTL